MPLASFGQLVAEPGPSSTEGRVIKELIHWSLREVMPDRQSAA